VLAAQYRERHGREPVNVSHWDPSPELARKLKKLLPIPRLENPISYQYSYLITERPDVLAKLGFLNSSISGLFTENGSLSISAVANWLSSAGSKQVSLFSPSYFITAHCLRRFGLNVKEISLPRKDNRYVWPEDFSIEPGNVLWVTNPIYNTGDYSIERYIDNIRFLADAGVLVVVDEAIALTPTMISRTLGGHRNFVGIYTPHKSICVNSLKFSIVTFNSELEDFFDDWADVLFGGLSLSSSAAIKHFLSVGFDEYRSAFLRSIEITRAWHNDLLMEYGNHISTDEGSRGHFLTVYFPSIEAALGDSLPFIEAVIEATGTAFIPGSRSGFNPRIGFCFRVNLAQDCARFRGAVARLYCHLAR
jgi:histidinol-phosphate/aromatic aminotransferase/cobyric acid decarboxylase-like protein